MGKFVKIEFKNVKLLLIISLSLCKGEIRESSSKLKKV